MKLVIFEDEQFARFYPLTFLRGVFELKSGAITLAAKIERAVGRSADAFLVRAAQVPTLTLRYSHSAINDCSQFAKEETLFVNARVCGTGFVVPAQSAALWRGDVLAVWRTSEDVTAIQDYVGLAEAARRSPAGSFEGRWFDYIWDVMLANPEEITADFEAAGRSGIDGQMHEQAVIFGPKDHLYIGEGAQIHPFVCIDTHGGPVTLEAGVEVHPFTRIEGPCYVGRDSILLGAKIREGCSIGPMCRVGGEVEESIIHGYSNKYHDGFLGHSYVGQWVNLGAMTTNSDLKNDYTGVTVKMNGATLDTGSNKVGSFIGDHVKTSIGTLMNTGTIIGPMAVCVATGAPLPKSIPAFGWFVNGAIGRGFGLEALLKTARMAMSRRGVELGSEEEALLRQVYEVTMEERMAAVRRARRQKAARPTVSAAT